MADPFSAALKGNTHTKKNTASDLGIKGDPFTHALNNQYVQSEAQKYGGMNGTGSTSFHPAPIPPQVKVKKEHPKTKQEHKNNELPGRDIPVIGPVLKGLDIISEKTEPAAAFMRSLYTPGAGISNVAGFTGAVGSKLAQLAPNLGKTALGRVGAEAIKEGVTGVPVAMGQSLANGETDTKEVLKQGVLGGFLGAAGGAAFPMIGAGAKKLLDKYSISKTVPVKETLALPEGKLGQRLKQAEGRGILTKGNEPIATPYTFKLNEGSAQTRGNIDNVKESWNDLSTINDELKTLENKYQTAVLDQYKYLKESLKNRGGVTQGGLIRDSEGTVTGRVGRISNNPKWYQDFYAENGKVPSNKELYELAKKHVDEGFQDDFTTIPSWKAENNYDETVSALTQVRDQIRSSLKEKGLNITDANLKTQELGLSPKNKLNKINKSVDAEVTSIQPTQVTREPILNNPKRTESSVQTTRERGFTTTLNESEKTTQGLRERLSNMYTPISNEEAVARANQRVSNNIEHAVDYVTRSRVLTAEHVATAHRLIDEFQKAGNFERANDIADRIAELGTKAGQSIQAFSIYNRLTPEGVLVHANRMAQRVNESLPRGVKEVKVTEDMAAQLTELAGTVQKMTGVKHAADDVMSILEKAKNGEKLNDIETQTIKRFVNEARQFVKEADPKKRIPRTQKQPKELSDKRVRDNVVSFLEQQERAAKDRLRARGIHISSMPLDIYADYALIGATKLAKGTIRFVDWSEEMVKELGEQIRPMLADVYEKAQETLNLSTKAISSQTISQAEKIAEKAINNYSLEGAEAETIRALAQRVSGLSGDAKRIASQDLQAVLNNIHKPSVLTKISSFQTMMQLLNPKTILIRNPLGNELFYRLERFTKLAATPVDWARVQLFGGQRSVTFRTHNQGQYWDNFIKGIVAGWKGVNPEGLTTQFDIRGQAFNGKWNPLTYMEKALGASLKGFDYAAYKRAVNHSLGELATLRAINEGLNGEIRTRAIQRYIRESDDNILRIADEYGKYVTFQDNNALSVGLQKFKRGLNFGKDFGLGDLVIKYPRTPGALVMRALEYSPVGVLRSLYIAANPFLKKDPNTGEAVMALTRAAIGTLGLSAFGYFLLDKGILTGAASKDRDIRDLQRQSGQGQYQVNIDAFKRFVKSGFNPDAAKLQEDDLLYTYDWAQPVAIAISMGANMKKNILDTEKKEGKLNLLGAAYRSAEGGLNTIVEQSVLSGIKRAFEGYPGQTVMDKVVDILADVPASFVPSLSNQINQVSDNRRRETYAPSKFDESMNRAKAKIPGLAQTLPQKYDTLGKPQTNMQNNSLINVFLNPGFASRYKLTPDAKMVVSLINKTGDESIAPRVPGKTLNVILPGNKVENAKLTTQQYSRLQKLVGEETSKLLKKVDPKEKTEDQLKQAAKALNNAGEIARKKLKKEMGVK